MITPAAPAAWAFWIFCVRHWYATDQRDVSVYRRAVDNGVRSRRAGRAVPSLTITYVLATLKVAGPFGAVR